MSLRILFFSGLNICLFSAFIVAQASLPQQLTPDRKVAGHTITSDHDPKVEIELPPSAVYAGADRFVLYEVADCEPHVFVEADPDKNVQRLYWVQFESYLPSKPSLHYTYDSLGHATIGGLDFYVDTWARATDERTRRGSDLEHIQALVGAKGYKLPAGMMSVRLVHLLDEAKRKELMIIYSEDLAATGFAASDLREGGNGHDRWPDIEKELIARAKKAIKIKN